MSRLRRAGPALDARISWRSARCQRPRVFGVRPPAVDKSPADSASAERLDALAQRLRRPPTGRCQVARVSGVRRKAGDGSAAFFGVRQTAIARSPAILAATERPLPSPLRFSAFAKRPLPNRRRLRRPPEGFATLRKASGGHRRLLRSSRPRTSGGWACSFFWRSPIGFHSAPHEGRPLN